MTKFQIYLPREVLRPYVKYFAVSEDEAERTYKVLPDTGMVAGFQYRGKLAYLDSRGAETALSTAGITGMLDAYRIFKNSAGAGTVLVYFREAATPAFFKLPADALFGESASLEQLWAPSIVRTLTEQLEEAVDDRERIGLVEDFLISRTRPASPDMLVGAAIALIRESDGAIPIGELAARLYISQSRLEKRFRAAAGATPKKFACLVRLKSVLKNHRPGSSMTELGYASGFYDQAHFTSQFKKFTGNTPEGFFRGANNAGFLQSELPRE
jgi:AraC-like DNA-binding protein